MPAEINTYVIWGGWKCFTDCILQVFWHLLWQGLGAFIVLWQPFKHLQYIGMFWICTLCCIYL